MPPGADLFVVCKNCGSEDSPYITECPYCGHRLRRRAPKIPRPGTPERSPRRGLLSRIGTRGGGRIAPEEAPRRAPRAALAATIAERPYATIALVAASCVMWVLLRAGFITSDRLLLIGPLHGDWWKLFSSQFSYLNGWYAFFTLLVVAIFGWLLERRFGAVVVLALFLGAGVGGALVALAVYPLPVVLGANAAALALLAAWAAPDVRAARAGHYYEGDLLGAGALAALMLAIPFAEPEASWLAGVTGGALGLLVGLGLHSVGHAEG
ncbi:MAG TPA: rhomboid family intramembrane serine protease [Solirubrobacteraceae bacterium]